MNAWWDYISQQLDVCKELDADFNVPMIHLMSHCVKQIRQHRALQHYSAGRHEQAHETNLKDCWNTSNHNLNYLPQVTTSQRPILCVEIGELNLKALAHSRETRVATGKVFPFVVDLAAPLGSQSSAKPEFKWPQNHRDENHPDAMIKDFRALLNKTQDTTHHVPIYSGTREFIKHKSPNKTYILDEQLHTMELCIYHGIKVQVEGLDGKHISQMSRCTASQS
jgi:hypothetical protein